MPSFVIDEIYVGDVVQGDVLLRDLSFDERMPEPPREMICPTDMPMCPDGTMSRGRGPNCEPLCDKPADVISAPPQIADFSNLFTDDFFAARRRTDYAADDPRTSLLPPFYQQKQPNPTPLAPTPLPEPVPTLPPPECPAGRRMVTRADGSSECMPIPIELQKPPCPMMSPPMCGLNTTLEESVNPVTGCKTYFCKSNPVNPPWLNPFPPYGDFVPRGGGPYISPSGPSKNIWDMVKR